MGGGGTFNWGKNQHIETPLPSPGREEKLLLEVKNMKYMLAFFTPQKGRKAFCPILYRGIRPSHG